MDVADKVKSRNAPQARGRFHSPTWSGTDCIVHCVLAEPDERSAVPDGLSPLAGNGGDQRLVSSREPGHDGRDGLGVQ